MGGRRRAADAGWRRRNKRRKHVLPKSGLGVFAVILIAGSWPYALVPPDRFPTPTPFSGPDLENPYASAAGHWWKANFHAHSEAWDGITNGHQPPAEVLAAYRKLGYDVTGLSNYQRIDGGSLRDPDFIPIYEHGYNIRKVHELVIGAKRVTWLDFPLDQTLSDKQYMLDRLDAAGGIVAIAHPWLRNGYTSNDLRYLTGYTLMEVIRRGHVGADRWDAALSAGHLSWIIGDDDEHNLDRPGDIGVSWTMVQAPSKRRADILAALRAGHTYAVAGKHGHNDILLRSVTLHGDTLTVRTDPGALLFRFIGQGGTVLHMVADSMQASYVFQPADTYVRTEIVTPHTRMLLNPVLRVNRGG